MYKRRSYIKLGLPGQYPYYYTMNNMYLTNRSQHNRIQINSETELHRDCFALYRQIDQRYNNIDGGSLMNLSTRKKTVQVQ